MENNKQITQTNNSEIRFEPTSKVKSMSELIKIQSDTKTKLSSIASIKKVGGLEMDFVFTKLQKHVLDILDFYEVKINNDVFDMLINDFLTVGYMLNGADLEIFLSNVRSGKYKNRVDLIEGREFSVKFFRLTPDVLIDWLKIYIHERSEAFATTQIKPKQQVTESELKVVKMFAEAVSKPEPKPEPKPDYFDLAKELQKFVDKEFNTNRLIDRQGDWKEIPYAMFGDLKLMQSEYVAARFNQIFENLTAEHSQLETEISLTDFLTTKVKEIIQ